MSSSPLVHYSPGQRAVCAREGLWLLIDRPLTDSLVLSLWQVIDDGGSPDQVLGTLLSSGMATLPDFVMAAAADSGVVRLVIRGALVVAGTDADGAFETTGEGFLTDQTRTGLAGALVVGPAGEGPQIPLVAGIVPAASITLTFEDATERAVPEAAAAVPEVEPELKPTSAPEPQMEPEPEPQPEPALLPPPTPARQPEAETPVDAETLAAAARYEHLFSAPTPEDGAVMQADGVPTVEPVIDSIVHPVVEPDLAAPDPVTVVHDHPGVAAYAADLAPPVTGGFIDSVPDFMGGPALPPPQPTVQHTPPLPVTPQPAAAAPGPKPGPAPVAPSPAAPAAGRTVNRASLRQAVPAVTVWAARCPLGHLSQAHASTCRVCRQPMPEQTGQEVPRPVLGRLVIAGANPIVLDSDVILGRDPHVPPGAATPPPRLVVLNDPRMEVSSQHASITLNFWDVCLTDLGSTNGTEVITPDGRRQRLAPQSVVTILPGTKVVFAEVLEATFETMP